jgi:hypothetical protein
MVQLRSGNRKFRSRGQGYRGRIEHFVASSQPRSKCTGNMRQMRTVLDIPRGYSTEDRLGKNIKDCRHHKNWPSKDHLARSSQTWWTKLQKGFKGFWRKVRKKKEDLALKGTTRGESKMQQEAWYELTKKALLRAQLKECSKGNPRSKENNQKRS